MTTSYYRRGEKAADCPHYIPEKYHHPDLSCHIYLDEGHGVIPTFRRCLRLDEIGPRAEAVKNGGDV